jgi:putative oxidoreductase
MAEAEREPLPLLPFLKPFYDFIIPWTWPLVRVAVGWDLMVHGYGKILRGMSGQAAALARSGFDWGVPFAVFLTVIELGGGICIALGLFTRFWAAAVAIEMGVLTFYLYWGMGFPGSTAATNTRCCGAWSRLRLHCAAADPIRWIAKSAGSCSPASGPTKPINSGRRS